MTISKEWFNAFLENRSEDLGACDLFGDAAAEAARVLMENWSDCWQDGYWDNEPGEAITKMLVHDIDHTIAVLQAWKNDLRRLEVKK